MKHDMMLTLSQMIPKDEGGLNTASGVKRFPVKRKTLGAFDFAVVVFLNIGDYNRGRDGSTGERDAEFFTLPRAFVIDHYLPKSKWDKVSVRGLTTEIELFKNKAGFEQIAKLLGIPKPTRAACEPSGLHSAF